MNKLIFALLVSASCFAQRIDVSVKDTISGARTIYTELPKSISADERETVVNNGIVFFSAGYQDVKVPGGQKGLYLISLNIVHRDKRVGCLKQESGKIILVLEDGSEITCSQISATDCDPVGFVADFVLAQNGQTAAEMKTNFLKLQTVLIKKILVVASETTIPFVVKQRARPLLREHFRLVAAELEK